MTEFSWLLRVSSEQPKQTISSVVKYGGKDILVRRTDQVGLKFLVAILRQMDTEALRNHVSVRYYFSYALLIMP